MADNVVQVHPLQTVAISPRLLSRKTVSKQQVSKQQGVTTSSVREVMMKRVSWTLRLHLIASTIVNLS